MSLLLTKTILDLGTMSLSMVRSSKLIMAAIRLRSRLERILCGVRWSTPMNSSRVLGVYFCGLDDSW